MVQSSEPMSAHISSKRPLSYPNWIFNILSLFCLFDPGITYVLHSILLCLPGLVDVRIKDDVVDIMVFEEIVPDISAVLESVVEHEKQVWVLATH